MPLDRRQGIKGEVTHAKRFNRSYVHPVRRTGVTGFSRQRSKGREIRQRPWPGDNDDRGNSGGPPFGRRAADPVAVTPHQQIVIGDRDRNAVRTYYRTEYDAGRWPPGLAKKNNGCLPPGQAKKAWAMGQPLPPHISYEPMPRALSTQLTPPPPGYEYGRVADDIVLMSTEKRVIAGLLGNLGNFRD